VGERNDDRNGEAGERNDDRNDARGAQNDDKSGAQDATSDGTRATAPPPSKKSNRSFGPTTAIGSPQRGPFACASRQPHEKLIFPAGRRGF
jgi:hypothetical protein